MSTSLSIDRGIPFLSDADIQRVLDAAGVAGVDDVPFAYDLAVARAIEREVRLIVLRTRYAAKLTGEQVAEIRAAYAKRKGRNWGCSDFARRFKVTINTVQNVAHGKTHRAVPPEGGTL